jgi:hypothetical protein
MTRALTHSLNRFHIKTYRSERERVMVLMRIVKIHSKYLLPSVTVRDVEESVAVVDPIDLMQDINPSFITILKDHTRSSWSVWLDSPDGDMVLKAIDLLNKDAPRGLVIAHVSKVAVTIAMVSFSIARN